MKHIMVILAILGILLYACGDQKKTIDIREQRIVRTVNLDFLRTANPNNTITKIPCTLSDGSKSECYQIITNSTPTDHQMGPWCPTNISDDASAGGIWLENGKVYDVDGAFVKNLADLYNDKTWRMYDSEGNINVTNTEEDCINAANPNVGEEYKNFCVECLPSYITTVSKAFMIPVKPVFAAEPLKFMGPGGAGRPPRSDKPKNGVRPPRGTRPDEQGAGIPSTRGIALNGVEFSAPAPVNNILEAYTLAPFDDAGGHINVHQGYHYHTATGLSYSVTQKDGHAPLIGYAIDGHGIYGRLDELGKESEDLDECLGHFDNIRGYHYHVDAPGNNNFINCIQGVYAN